MMFAFDFSTISLSSQSPVFFRRLVAILLLYCGLTGFSSLMAQPTDLPKELYNSAVVLEASTQRVLFADRAHEQVIPASTIKIMVSLLTMEAVNQGRVSLEDEVVTSRWASKIGGHQVYLREGETFLLKDLLKAVVIGSANDAVVAVGEHVAGSQEEIVRLMNQRAQELGMNNTTFANPHGLPPSAGQQDNYSTAYDMALLGVEVLKHPKILELSSTELDSFRDGTFQLLNTNRRLLRRVRGLDGLKTGYHRKAGFSVIASAKRQDLRLIAAVMGARSSGVRNRVTARLLEWGFREFGFVSLLEKGVQLEQTVVVEQGKATEVAVITASGVETLLAYDDQTKVQTKVQLPEKLIAPVTAGSVVGKLELTLGEEVLASVNLLAAFDVEKQTFWNKLRKKLPL